MPDPAPTPYTPAPVAESRVVSLMEQLDASVKAAKKARQREAVQSLVDQLDTQTETEK